MIEMHITQVDVTKLPTCCYECPLLNREHFKVILDDRDVRFSGRANCILKPRIKIVNADMIKRRPRFCPLKLDKTIKKPAHEKNIVFTVCTRCNKPVDLCTCYIERPKRKRHQ